MDGIAEIPLPGQSLNSDLGPDPDRSNHRGLRRFIAGPENPLVRFAVRCVLGDSPKGHDPLVLYGPSGTGKTHLARGLTEAWTAQSDRRAEYITAIDFARELANAIETQAVDEFRERFRRAGLLVVEDIGQLVDYRAAKATAQEELIHTLDAVRRCGGRVVVTASAAPGQLARLVPGLQSRLSEGLAVGLRRPGPDTRLMLLRCSAQQRDIELSEPAARALADGLDGTVPELLGALVQLGVPAGLDGRVIDAEAVRQYLRERNGSRQLPLSEIAVAVARLFSLKLSALRSPSRRRAVVTARNVAIYLSRQLTQTSFGEIGRYFGGRDHSTVMHGYRQLELLLESDLAIREAVTQLQEKWKQ